MSATSADGGQAPWKPKEYDKAKEEVEKIYSFYCYTHCLEGAKPLTGKPKVCPKCYGPLKDNGCCIKKIL